MANTILWVYIVLLVVGGVMGFVKAGSKVSLITSAIFAVLLALFASGVLVWRAGPEVLLVLLLVVFVVRLAKTKKFMPSGMMVALTAVTLALRLFLSSGA